MPALRPGLLLRQGASASHMRCAQPWSAQSNAPGSVLLPGLAGASRAGCAVLTERHEASVARAWRAGERLRASIQIGGSGPDPLALLLEEGAFHPSGFARIDPGQAGQPGDAFLAPGRLQRPWKEKGRCRLSSPALLFSSRWLLCLLLAHHRLFRTVKTRTHVPSPLVFPCQSCPGKTRVFTPVCCNLLKHSITDA